MQHPSAHSHTRSHFTAKVAISKSSRAHAAEIFGSLDGISRKGAVCVRGRLRVGAGVAQDVHEQCCGEPTQQRCSRTRYARTRPHLDSLVFAAMRLRSALSTTAQRRPQKSSSGGIRGEQRCCRFGACLATASLARCGFVGSLCAYPSTCPVLASPRQHSTCHRSAGC